MDIFKIIILILTVISGSIIPLVFELRKAKVSLDGAKTDADRERSIVEMIDVVRQLIVIAERTYAEATGQERRSAVLGELEAYAKEKDYAFDMEYWGVVIDSLVAMCKKVNVGK